MESGGLRFFLVVAISFFLRVAEADCQIHKSQDSDSLVFDQLDSPPPPPPPPPPKEGSFINREIQPVFPGCENLPHKEAVDCTGKKIVEHIYQNLVIPEGLDEAESNCLAIVQFVIGVDGKVSNFALLRDPCEGCGAAALAAAKSLQQLPSWTPARQYGRVTKILYTLPVKFDKSTQYPSPRP